MPSAGETAVAYVDGGFRPQSGEIGSWSYIITAVDGRVLRDQGLIVGGSCTIAEYLAILKALEGALGAGVRDLHVQSDCQSVVAQLTRQAGVRSPALRPLYRRVKGCERWFSEVRYTHVPRIHPGIRVADAAGRQVLAQEGVGGVGSG
jgi:ribonuclease HI